MVKCAIAISCHHFHQMLTVLAVLPTSPLLHPPSRTANCIMIAPKRLKLRLSGSARKSQKRFRDTPRFKFQAVLARTQPFLSRSVEKRGDQSRFKCRKMVIYSAIRSNDRRLDHRYDIGGCEKEWPGDSVELRYLIVNGTNGASPQLPPLPPASGPVLRCDPSAKPAGKRTWGFGFPFYTVNRTFAKTGSGHT
jgi:hypothetical protein